MNRVNRNRRYSLSAKLVLLFIMMAILFVVLVGGAIRHTFQEHFRDNVRPHIMQYLEYVKTDIGDPPDRNRARELAERLNIEIQIDDKNGRWSSSGRLINIGSVDAEHRFSVDGNRYFHVEHDHKHYLMVQDNETTLLFNVPNVREHRKGIKGWLPLLTLLILLLVLYYATRRLFAPLNAIKQGVEKFGAGNMDHRIDIRRKDELGDLAASFNSMADDIQQMLDAKRQLLLAISHELRSPLTRARLATEMLDDSKNKEQIIADINAMESLIEELMETERLSHRHRKLNKSRHDVAALISDILASHFDNSGISVTLPSDAVMLDIDAARMRLLLKNLLDNAVQYTPENAPRPEITLKTDSENVSITVTDHGSGIAAYHLPYLTEPFYRVDSSRQRETGGYGLGLYLCRMIAEAHFGSLEINSVAGAGTSVTVTLPCRPE